MPDQKKVPKKKEYLPELTSDPATLFAALAYAEATVEKETVKLILSKVFSFLNEKTLDLSLYRGSPGTFYSSIGAKLESLERKISWGMYQNRKQEK